MGSAAVWGYRIHHGGKIYFAQGNQGFYRNPLKAYINGFPGIFFYEMFFRFGVRDVIQQIFPIKIRKPLQNIQGNIGLFVLYFIEVRRRNAADFFARFPGATGVFVQEQVPPGLELIVGGVWDPQLGSAVMAGLGGVWVEIMKDLVFGYPPIGKAEALDLITGLRSEPLLAGYRGKPRVNREALAELIARIGALLLALPEISEIDLNPVIYDPARDAFIAADARIRKG